MMLFARAIGEFVSAHPSIKMLALSFLVVVGVVLIAEGFDHHVPKGYVYFAMAFSVAVEMLNIHARKKRAGQAGRAAQPLPRGRAGATRSALARRRLLAPAAAEHLVQRHQVLRRLRLHLHQRLLRREQRALRVEQLEVAGRAVAVAQLGQPVARAARPRACALLRAQLLAERGAAGQRIGDLAEGRSGSRARTAPRRCRGWPCASSQVGLVAAGVEDRLQQLRREAPGRASRDLNRSDRSPLAVPTLPVSVMRGKKAARAAPMLALAAISCCSAWRTSGRRVSTSDGRPAGSSGRPAAPRAAQAGGRSAGSGWPTSSTSAFSSSARWRVSCASADARRLEQRLGLAQVELGAGAVVEAQLGQPAATPRAWPASAASRAAARRRRAARGAALATAATRLICTALRASSVARYCASAASLRLRTRPNRSSS